MKKFIIALLILTVCLGIGMTACKNKATVKLNKNEITVEKYKNTWLEVEYDGDKELTWSSNNTSVAVVDNGMVTGVNQGQAKIVVTDGKVSSECLVTVTATNPEKYGIWFEKTKIDMFIDETITLSPVVTYDNVPLSGASFEFATDSSNITVNDAGVVTASGCGLATVTVKSKIENKDLSAVVKINVVDVYEVVVQQKDVILYPYAEYEGNTYDNSIICTANVLERGQAINFDEKNIIWSVDSNQDVITVDQNGLVTAHNGGNAKLYASYVLNGKTVVGYIDVKVMPIEVHVPDIVLDAGISTPFVPSLKTIMGIDEDITKIIVNANGMNKIEISPENGKYDMSSLIAGDASIALVTRNLAYTFSSVIYDGIINSIDDMKVLLTAEKGSYKFATDLDMSEYSDNGGIWESSAKFIGSIDGGNHVIKNFKTSTGIFKSFNGGEIKNIAFTSVETIGATGVFASGIDYYESKAISIDNVFVSNKSNSGGWYVGLIGHANLLYPLSISNSVIISSPSLSYGALTGRVGTLAVTIDNCYLINTSIYRKSLNENLSEEDQQKLHDPNTNDYKTYKNYDEAYDCYLKNEINVSDFLETCFEKERKVVLISSKNVAELLTATDGIYQLVEDIDMSTAYTANGGVWASSTTFNGVLDGQGHKITNFKTSTGLFEQVGGTVKNIAIIDAVLESESQIGVLAKQASLDLQIENVIFTIASIDITTWIGGSTLFGDYRTPHTVKVSVKNSLLWNKANTATLAALASWEPANVIEVIDSYLISERSIVTYEPCGHGVDSHVTGSYSKYSNFDALVIDFLDGKIDDASDFIKDFIKECGNIKEINKNNVGELLTATSGVYQIVEDIDMSIAYTENNGIWASNTTFNGVLDGQGYKITNFKTSTGLFEQVGGTVKNLLILDATLISETQIGVLAKQACSNLVIDNVIFTVTSIEITTWIGGSTLFGDYRTDSHQTVILKNSLLWNKANSATIAALSSWNPANVIEVSNSYLVSAGAEITYEPCGHGKEQHITGTYSKFIGFDELILAYNNNEVTGVSSIITDFIVDNGNNL